MSDEHPVYLTTERESIEKAPGKRETTPDQEKAFANLDKRANESERLLRRHATPTGSLESSRTYLNDLLIAVGGPDALGRWSTVLDTVQMLTVCLTHLWSAKKGVWLGGAGLLSRLKLNISTSTATGYWDDVHQGTSGFLFMLGHFGHPFDLKHMSVYGKESVFPGWHDEQQESYAQRRFVCLDADVGLYTRGLVMIHDAVWPRHLMGSSTTKKYQVACEARYEDVKSGARFLRKPDELPKLQGNPYDPHGAAQGDPYIRAEVLRLTCGGRATEVRPLDSVVAGCGVRAAVALEVVRFAQLVGKQPAELQDVEKLIDFINEWIRPQVMLPWSVDIPNIKNIMKFPLWEWLGEGTPSEVTAFLTEHYKKVGEDWQPALGLSSRKLAGNYDLKAPYYKSKDKPRPSAKGGFRAFGWPREKYSRVDIRTIGAELTTEQRATGNRAEYETLWNGLPELAAYSAFRKTKVSLTREHCPTTVIQPFENATSEITRPWEGKPLFKV